MVSSDSVPSVTRLITVSAVNPLVPLAIARIESGLTGTCHRRSAEADGPVDRRAAAPVDADEAGERGLGGDGLEGGEPVGVRGHRGSVRDGVTR